MSYLNILLLHHKFSVLATGGLIQFSLPRVVLTVYHQDSQKKQKLKALVLTFAISLKLLYYYFSILTEEFLMDELNHNPHIDPLYVEYFDMRIPY